jgi:glycosyltransferase involved in cell wall biosynthesis
MFAEYLEPNGTRLWLAAHRARRFRWIKIIHDGTLPVRWDRFEPARRRLAARTLQAADVLVPVGEELAVWARTYRGSRPIDPISSLLPLPAQPRAALPPAFAAMREASPQVVCVIGAFTEEYGVPQVVEAVAALRSSCDAPDAALIVLGTSFARDPQLEANVARHRWVLVLQDLPHAQALAVMAASDVVVRAVARESYGLARVEAILSGTPVVATPTGETRGMVLYETPDQLRSALRAVLDGAEEPNLPHWQAVFRAEAERNAATLARLASGA